MEMTTSNHCWKAFPTFEGRKNKDDFKKNSTWSKSSTKESRLVTIGEPIRISGKPRVEEKQRLLTRDVGNKASRKEIPIP